MPSSQSIFISYRRSDTIGHTGRMYDRLVAEFGREHVFKDVDDIPLGVDFAEHLDKAVSQCQVVIVVIGKTWTTVVDEDGNRRLDSPDDFVRIESPR
ncbi:MAG: TIR domain-containing protein [Cyanobacteria bacterium P01_A01_bin.116]